MCGHVRRGLARGGTVAVRQLRGNWQLTGAIGNDGGLVDNPPRPGAVGPSVRLGVKVNCSIKKTPTPCLYGTPPAAKKSWLLVGFYSSLRVPPYRRPK